MRLTNGVVNLDHPLYGPAPPCPYCNKEYKVMKELILHLSNTHGWAFRCGCGIGKGWGPHWQYQLAMHLTKQKDIGVHLAKAQLLAQLEDS